MGSDICWAAGPKAVEAKWPEIYISTEFVLCFFMLFPRSRAKIQKNKKTQFISQTNAKKTQFIPPKKTIDTKNRFFEGDFRTVEMVSWGRSERKARYPPIAAPILGCAASHDIVGMERIEIN